MSYSPFLSCRQASRLISARLDRELGPLDRIALQFHLRICTTCPTVVRQMAVLRDAMRSWRETSEQ